MTGAGGATTDVWEGPPVGSARHAAVVVRAAWKSSLAGSAEYRGDLVVGTLVSIVWLAVSAVPAVVVSLNSAGAGGWTLPRLMCLLGVWYLMDAVMWIVVMPNVGQWGEQVRSGTLDGVLLRPVHSLVLCSFRVVGVQDVPKVLLALALVVTSLVLGGGPPSVLALLAGAVCVACGLVLLWALAVLTSYKVLSHVQWDASFLLHAGLNLGRVPIPLYGDVLRVVLTWVVPVAFLTTVPAQVLFGMVPWWTVGAALGFAAASVVVVVVLWNRELRRYAGAMG
ncbi:ABC transporter permease [Cellulomonas phragmiteti]|uniref:ABC transporter permease n=1 Tax=Cellulomonas phragmiteti TaxID=478780 RepID=A0ABQ4DR17_9CELL|nr:ABC-2 family transporter protein [Cellulomonas phragmiteti]GIG41802.1 hypothetical protein Cph01nite_35640 [Cellulomonas phragmiteti]